MNKLCRFQEYLRNNAKLKDSSISHYSTELNGRIMSFAKKFYPDFIDLFDLEKAPAEQLISYLVNDAVLRCHVKSSHGVQITALNHYLKFLEQYY